MRPHQRQRYAQQIDRVVQHLEKHDWAASSQAPDLAVLAATANLSPFHFHRIFRLMTGESIGELIRRLRLARGVAVLNNTSAQVTQAAMTSGYATPQAFARAVRQATGRTPTDLQRSQELVLSLKNRLQASCTRESTPPLSIEITSIDPFTVKALRNVGDYNELNAAYERLFEIVFAQQSLDTLQCIYGVPLDDPFSVSPQECRFECAVQLDSTCELAPPIRSMQLGGGTYVVSRHVGDYNLIHTAIDQLFGALIDCEGVELADAPVHIQYHDQPEDRPTHELRANIFVAIDWEV